MNRFLSITATYFIILVGCISFAQDIYVYPNKKLADQGLIEYRRYTLEEARAYEQGGSFEPYLNTSWSNEQRLTQQENVYGPKVVTSGDSIFSTYGLIWGRQVFFIKSNNAGNNWEPYLTLVDTSNDYSYLTPEITKYNNDLLIGFINQDQADGNGLCYFKSTDNGTTWGTLHNILPYFDWNYSTYSSFSNSGRDLYASYIDFGRDSIYVIRSWNFGVNWVGRGVNVAYLNSTPQPMTIRISGTTLHLIWVNEVMPVSVRYSRNTDSGRTWSPEIDIANDSLGSQRCCVSVQGQHVVASWMGYKYSPYMFTGDMFIKQSYDGGATWDPAMVLTDSHYVWMGSNYIKDSLIVVTWQDTRFGGNNNEAMARYSTNYGQTWSDETRLSYGDFDSHSPIACITQNRIHVLWGDGRPEEPGLYYSDNDISSGIDINQIPTSYGLLHAYPNPFNSSVIFKNTSNLIGRLCIYNIAGQLVKTLNTARKEGQVKWNGADDKGQPLSSGVYLVAAKTSLGMQHLKVTFLK